LTFVACTTGALQTRQHTAMNIGMTKEGTNTSTFRENDWQWCERNHRQRHSAVRQKCTRRKREAAPPAGLQLLLMFVFSFGVAGVRSSN
jgi:hypothetical protein